MFQPLLMICSAIMSITLSMTMIAAAEPVDITADEISRSADGVMIARGNVVIKRQWDTLMADHVTYRSQQQVLEAKGHVVIKSEKAIIEADQAMMHTQSNTGHMDHAIIKMPSGDRLTAKRLKQLDDHTYEADQMIFSSCPIDDDSWRVAASHAVLDQQDGSVTAQHARFELLGFPILYSPWWQQPLKRKSGLLIPKVAFGKRRGTEVSLPYYFAPYANWDATLTPHWMSERGLMGELEARHISSLGYEEINIASISDTVTASRRSRLGGSVNWQLPASMQFSASGDYVSDNLYVADYATGDQISSVYLHSGATLSQAARYNKLEGSWSLQAAYVQNLLLPNNDTTLQILPRLQSHAQWRLLPNMMLHLGQQSTRFSRRIGQDGWRVNLHPYIEIPWSLEAGGVSAVLRAGSQHTRYKLQDTTLLNANPIRTTGEASLEVRMDFERVGERGVVERGRFRQWRHVVSPIMRYDHVSAPNQSLLPNFDSGFGQLTWSNLLSGNHFSGLDRVEKTKRFSLLLENRLQLKSKDGVAASDILIVRGGMSYDLLQQSIDVTLQAAPARPLSNLLAEVIWQPLTNMRIYSSGQYNPADGYWTNYTAAADVTLSANSLHVDYQFTDRRYSTKVQFLNVRANAALGRRWKASATWQYDMLLKLSQQTTLGLKYDHPCWTLGLETYKLISPIGTGTSANYGYRLLLEFKGLGSVAF